jgi:hypothetical protein
MKKIKHSKFKNTGVLFELLVRQITLEILNGDSTERAKEIIKEFFKNGTELNRELRLYELLLKERYNSESNAEKFVETVCEAREKLNDKKLSKEKYELVKKINESFDINQFLASPILNYKVLASIYKVFESKKEQNYDIKDIFNSKITLIENIISKPILNQIKNEDNALVESYKKQDKDIRLLTYKILVDNFNKKYSNLNDIQKKLLKEYINNVNNTSKFKDYVVSETPKIISELKSINKSIKDSITKIKLTETIAVLEKQKVGKVVSDNMVSSLMLSYELIKELKSKINES